ncbi:MAG TPA: prolyl oligopeptidase family serine peptidase [Acidobacteriaceae bacterium]|nr:prolyl oligopeptidase family serine peptidase [Acidobacteriaceae bacterium]
MTLRVPTFRVQLFFAFLLTLSLSAQTPATSQTKPPLTLNAYFAASEYTSARLSPDGTAAVIAAREPDWMANRFREDLWLWRAATGKLEPLTVTGHDSGPDWSPDGRFIAFTSDRLLPDEKPSESKDGKDKDETPGRIWIVSADGGEARPLYRSKDDVHSFAWAADGTAIYLAIQEPLSKDQTDAKARDWKDVTRYRTSDRGDVLLRIPIPRPPASAAQPNATPPTPAPGQQPLPEGATVIARSPLAIDLIKIDGHSGTIAFVTGPISHRLERPEDTEIYSVAATGVAVTQLTHNQGLENNLRWSPDGERLYFTVQAAAGSVEGPYRDVQGRLYSISAQGGTPQRLGADFDGNWQDYTVLSDGTLLATGTRGTSTQVYRVKGAHAEKLAGVDGTYGGLDAARQGDALLLTHSAIREPQEVYIASSPAHLDQAKPLTHFNAHYLNYAQSEWRPYTWKSFDGTTVEGVLIYPPDNPPEKRDAKHLPMLTFIHGGPADADGDRFGADWYDWATMAAAQGWLVFRPNYRGSAGYGDAFMQQITPHIVSVPGKDILAGVDALVADGTADPTHLVIGGYSYGGYMTNWLITQTTRFRAAVTGAGAVEHAANWGNDDETYDDAAYLGGRPWEKPAIYQSEAAIFQMNKVTTPTHMIAGDADIRVSFLEDIMLEHALESLNIPHALLTFPGEGHPLSKNPWHGYIAVREELKWINKYGDHSPPAP